MTMFKTHNAALIALTWIAINIYFGIAGYAKGQVMSNIGLLSLGWIFGSSWSKARSNES